MISFAVKNMADVMTVRRKGLETALEVGFVRPDATKLAVVISELGRNIVQYAEEGTITVAVDRDETPRIRIIARDVGPGIADLDHVLSGQYISRKGLGIGLMGSRSIMDDFHIKTIAGVGTTITASMIRR